MIPDVASITREFDYVVPQRWADLVQIGSMVRVPLHGRQVAAWVVGLDVESPAGVVLRAVSKVSSIGPSSDIIELCRWAAWRWCGRVPQFLGVASPPSMSNELPSARPHRAPTRGGATFDHLFAEAVNADTVNADTVNVDTVNADARPGEAASGHVRAVELPPADSPVGILLAAARRGPMLVIAPTYAQCRDLADELRRAEVHIGVHPDAWWRGAVGASVIGTRSAVFAPVAGLASIVVIDEHDEALQNEGSPTWHAREVAMERARRAGIPVVLVSPVPSLECRSAVDASGAELMVPSRPRRRRGWAPLELIDRREDDIGRSGLYSAPLVNALQSGQRVMCVLNRTGRAQMLACLKCGTLATCERCEASVRQQDEFQLTCPSCALTRPVVCNHCGSSVLKSVRIGVTKAAEQLETLLREPVEQIAGDGRSRSGAATVTAGRSTRRVVVGTEAAMHRAGDVDVVAFLEFDQELAAPRYRAGDQAMALLARAARLVGGRMRDGRVLVQTRQPDHDVLIAAQRSDPGRLVDAERALRAKLLLPPMATLAAIGGAAAPEFIAGLRSLGSERALADLRIDQQGDHEWIVRSKERGPLLDLLSEVRRAPGRLRLQIDPARLP